jgi:type 1 fimbriae regulatory protein FimB/type 1 fimbriae regulatory protein FimE
MLGNHPNEIMSTSPGSPESAQLTKVRELNLDSPNRSRNNRKYKEVREREYLYEHEVEAMLKVAKAVGRHGHRDATFILLAYRHGLRVTELVNLRWQQVNLKTGHIHINRLKGSRPSVHPLSGVELRSLRQLQRDYPDSPFLFVSERGGPMTADAARKVIVRAGEEAGLPFPVHPHQLRHGCGYYLAMKGHDTRAIQDYLGHVNIHHTVKYTALSSSRFEGFWQD